MDYQRIYNSLIERANDRILEGYFENHHIVPKCLGGTDDVKNLTRLTPEEHYVAHQLLVKIYPKNQQLIYAAQMMTVSSENTPRNNKLYGWLKRKYSIICKQRIGEKNGSFGSFWITNGIESKRIKDEIPEGWQKGRNLSSERMERKIVICIECMLNKKIVRENYNKIYVCGACNTKRSYKKIQESKKTNKNYIHITNGYKDYMISRYEIIPEGFRKGRTKGLRKKCLTDGN